MKGGGVSSNGYKMWNAYIWRTTIRKSGSKIFE